MRIPLATIRVLCLCGLYAVVTQFVFATPCAEAQVTNRGQTYDRIFDGLLNSQMSSQSNSRLVPIPQNQVSAQMQNARRGLQQFSTGARQLTALLRQEELYSSAIRPLVGEAITVQASAEVLVNLSNASRELSDLIPDYQRLDRDWRSLAHRVEQWPGLRQNIIQQVTSMSQLNDQLGQLLKVTPQFETNELTNLLTELSIDFARLNDDIKIDLIQDSQQTEYLRQMQQLQSMVYYLRQAISASHPHDEIVGRFKQMYSTWLPLQAKLRLIDSRYIQRSMTRVAQSNHRAHELLWIPEVISGDEVLALATSLKQSVNQIADQVSLRKLLESPNATAVFERAKEFYTLAGDFRQSVTVNTDLEALKWDFRALDVAWSELRTALAYSRDPQTLQYVTAVDFTVGELRETLGERPIFDNNESVELIASIDSMSDLLHFDIANGIDPNRYDQNFRSNIVRSSQAFHRLAHALPQKIGQNGNSSAMNQSVAQLVNQWRELYGYVTKVTFDRPQTMNTAQQISIALAKLQVNYQ